MVDMFTLSSKDMMRGLFMGSAWKPREPCERRVRQEDHLERSEGDTLAYLACFLQFKHYLCGEISCKREQN